MRALHRCNLCVAVYLVLSLGVQSVCQSSNQGTVAVVEELVRACYDGNIKKVRSLLKRDVRVDAKDAKGRFSLLAAAAQGYVDIVRLLVEKGASLETCDNDGYTALYAAAVNGHAAVVKYLIEEGASVDAKCSDGATPLHAAAGMGHLEVVRLLVKSDASSNVMDNAGYTPLSMAAHSGDVGIVAFLLGRGANINMKIRTISYVPPLYVAAARGHLEVVKLLVERGAWLEDTNKEGYTPLAVAASAGHVGIVKFLLSRGANVDKASRFIGDDTPLMHAINAGHADVVKVLVEAGACSLSKCMELAEKSGNSEIIEILREPTKIDARNADLKRVLLESKIKDVKELIAGGMDVNARLDSTGSTVLIFACRYYSNDSPDVVHFLVESGARVDDADKDGNTALTIVSNQKENGHQAGPVMGRTKKARALLERGAAVDLKNKAGKTALMYACEYNLDLAELLLSHGADINAKDRDGVSVLMHASRADLPKVELLLAKGADIDHKDNLGRSVLMYAAAAPDHTILKIENRLSDMSIWREQREYHQGRLDLIAFMVDRMRPVIDDQDQKGATALMYAARADNLTMVKCLLESGAAIGAQDGSGNTALEYAIFGDHLRIVKYLVEKGIDITKANEQTGATSLMCAAAKGSREIAEFLHNGAPELVKIRDRNGSTALMYAANAGDDTSMVRFLVENGSEINAKNKAGYSALKIARLKGHNGVVRFLEKGPQHFRDLLP